MTVKYAQAAALSKPAAQNTEDLKEVFTRIDIQSCPHSFNFHMHTTCSDGKLHPEALMEQAIAIGLKGLAITDHHTIKGYQLAQQWLDQWKLQAPRDQNPPHLWTGVEINADLVGTEVHILGYAFDPLHASMEPYLQRQAPRQDNYRAVNVIAAIHAAGGVAVLAHPVRYHRSPTDLIPAAAALGIDGVETYYAYGNPNPWHPSPKQTEQVRQLSGDYGLLNTCGTDTHGTSLLMRL